MKYSRLIEVDINDVKQINVPCIVQGSINENLQIKLRNNGKVYNLTDCKVIYEIIKPDNNICSGVVDITVPNSGFGIIQLTKQAVSCVGMCKINLSVLSSNKEIKVNSLKYEVTPGESEVISWSENLVDLPFRFVNNTYNSGRSVNKWYDFVGDPDNSIGIDGDYALQLPKGDIWKKQQGYWERCGNIKGEKGEPGVDAVGTPGKDGTTPNLTIGEVSTVESGNDANATITGSLENPVLNLKIPKGDAFRYEDFTESQLEGLKVKGDKGSTWYDGVGRPVVSLGNDKDYYLNTSNYDIYTKINSIWERVGNIRGTIDDVDTSKFQTKTDNFLETVDKTIVGAINEVNKKQNNIDLSAYATKEELESKSDKSHTHSNYSEITHNHNENYAVKSSEHTHTNKVTLDKITEDKLTEWNGKADREHNHSNYATTNHNHDETYSKKTETYNKSEIYTKGETDAKISEEIEKAQVGGSEVDLSSYATKEELKTKADIIHSHADYSPSKHNHDNIYAKITYVDEQIQNVELTPGERGEQGFGWLFGQNSPTNEGRDGDLYYKYDTFDVYRKDGGTWKTSGNLKGAKGDKGDRGEPGAPADLSNYYTKVETDEKISQEIANAQLNNGEVDLSAYATKEELRGKADVSHTHSNYSETTHNHNSLYAPLTHSHEEYASSDHNHNTSYAAKSSEHIHENKTTLDKVTEGKINEWNNKADVTHTHDNYSETTHNHDEEYSNIVHEHEEYSLTTHNHNENYANKSSEHTHTNKSAIDKVTDTKINEWNGKANSDHNHDTLYANIEHEHDYSPNNHNHNNVYSSLNHNHNDLYATKSSEHTHSNKTTLDKITEGKLTEWDNKSNGNHTHDNYANLKHTHNSEDIIGLNLSASNITVTDVGNILEATNVEESLSEIQGSVINLQSNIIALQNELGTNKSNLETNINAIRDIL